MRRFEYRGLNIEPGGLFSTHCVLVSGACVLPVYKLRATRGIGAGFINTPRISLGDLVYKQPQNTCGFTQLGTSLCTTFQHILRTISSGGCLVLHIVHRAYKKEYELKKGIK